MWQHLKIENELDIWQYPYIDETYLEVNKGSIQGEKEPESEQLKVDEVKEDQGLVEEKEARIE